MGSPVFKKLATYDANTRRAKFYNVDFSNDVGLQLELDEHEFDALNRYLAKLEKDLKENTRAALASKIRDWIVGDDGHV